MPKVFVGVLIILMCCQTSSGQTCLQAGPFNYIVNNPDDDGTGTLREAIQCANQNPYKDTITFDLAVSTIELLSELPPITDNNGLAIIGTDDTGNPTIIDCSQIPDRDMDQTVLHILANDTEIYGLEMINLDMMIDIETVAYIRVGDFGTNVDGTIIGSPSYGNAFHSLRGGADGLVNLYSCVYLDNGTNTFIQNNAFGVSFDRRSIPYVEKNTSGVNVGFQYVGPVLIGGIQALTANHFGGLGIGIFGTGTESTIRLVGNYFGVSGADQALPLPITDTAIDLFMDNSSIIENIIQNCNTGMTIGLSDNLIERNRIENVTTGISMGQRGALVSTGSRILDNIIRNCFVGISTLPAVSDLEISNNLIEQNEIGISAGYNGDENIGHIYKSNSWVCNEIPIMHNDPHLAPPAPIISGYENDMITGSSIPNALIVVFLSDTCDPSVCQGREVIASSVTDDAGEFEIKLFGANPQNLPLTVHATSRDGVLHTSEFSNCIQACTVSQIDLGSDQTICAGSILDLDIMTEPNETIRWSDGSTSNKFVIDQEGEYSVIVSADGGCMAKDTIMVGLTDKLDVTIQSSADVLTCDTKDIELTANFGTPQQTAISWNTIDGNIVSAVDAQMITLDSPGEYKLIIPESEDTCPDTVSYSIASDVEAPLFTLIEQQTLDCESGEGLLSINWLGAVPTSFENTWFRDDIAESNNDNELIYTLAGKYKLEITNTANGCMSRDSLLVDPFGNCEEAQLFVPNVISPLSDNMNSILTIGNNAQVMMINSLQIIDRWNNIIFTQENVLPENISWDGKHLNDLVSSGVYLFQLVYTLESGERISHVQDITIVY